MNFVGNYDSIIKTFSDSLGVNDAASSNHRILDKLDEHYKKYAAKNTLLVIVIDEFGKFLEYAAKNDPESELYFIQQLAEYANDKNCIRASSRTQGRFIKRSVKNGKR
ncbi:MAG: hypothetical protein GWN00_09915 [Aliifodinibius sp.]|nr:hypothetical protein [Fodinibius sp.]NIV11507.1 hypothetical protein [Fodinibius sp.]NIY25107.1 hypothetical protein [Fodinibius sp.]